MNFSKPTSITYDHNHNEDYVDDFVDDSFAVPGPPTSPSPCARSSITQKRGKKSTSVNGTPANGMTNLFFHSSSPMLQPFPVMHPSSGNDKRKQHQIPAFPLGVIMSVTLASLGLRGLGSVVMMLCACSSASSTAMAPSISQSKKMPSDQFDEDQENHNYEYSEPTERVCPQSSYSALSSRSHHSSGGSTSHQSLGSSAAGGGASVVRQDLIAGTMNAGNVPGGMLDCLLSLSPPSLPVPDTAWKD
ncbi:hypothetical protein DL93DRAFT_2174131 [Clavulina sp. PMI_390]|nr:hypothetical protein DL93DRAFT_2174131 [Clavulina sp. PMI_390]